MKKILFVLTVTLFLSACNSDSGKKEKNESGAHQDHDTTVLSLNNGVKWKADSITNSNVENLKTLTNNFREKPFPTVAEYQLLSNDLSEGLNTMIQQCKMSDPDHEALHHWLEPVLSETKELKKVSDTAKARKVFNTLAKEIDSYHTYFE